MKTETRRIPTVKPLSLFAFIFLMVACSNNNSTLSKQDKEKIETEVKSVLNKYYDDIRAQGLNAEFKYLDSSDAFFWKPPGFSTAISFDSVACILKRNAGAYKLVDNSFDTLKVEAIFNDYASYTAYLKSIMIDTSGKSTQFRLYETGMLVKRKDGWKLLSGETSLLENKE